uniref:Uncharacterized protein n=1 Tax=Oryza rufipogon TaxID=4529 RepID=A0A0E0R7U9_ORYRU
MSRRRQAVGGCCGGQNCVRLRLERRQQQQLHLGQQQHYQGMQQQPTASKHLSSWPATTTTLAGSIFRRQQQQLHLGQQQHYQGMQQQQANVGRSSSSQLHLSILALGQQQQQH